MKLRPKVIIFLAVVWIFILSLVAIESYFVILGHYQKMEDESINVHYLQVQNAMNRSIDSLHAIALDWAHWDDSYRFLKDRNQSFIKSNLDVFSTYIDGKLNFILFYDHSGQYFYGRAFGLHANGFVNVPTHLLNYIKQHPNLRNHSNINEHQTGFIKLPDAYVMITSYPVTDSRMQAKPIGNIIMGYYFNDTCVKILSDTIHMPLSFISLETIKSTPGLEPIFTALQTGIKYIALPKNKNIMQIYSLIRDIDHRPIALLRIDLYRYIYMGGLSTIYRYLVIIAAMGVIVLILMWLYLKKVLLNRLFSFNQQLNTITKNSDFSKRIQIAGNDELSAIAESNNNLLKIIEISQEQLKYRLNLNIQELKKLSEFNKNLSEEVHQHISIEEQLKKDRALLQQGAYYDSLTALPNRFLFFELLNKSIETAKRSNTTLAILFIDIDGYKNINDTYGHATGDAFLQHIAHQITSVLRQCDVAGRIGGDEFIVLIENINTKDLLTPFIERLLHALNQPFTYEKNTIQATASIGISLYPADGHTLDLLCKTADQAMYHVKKHGKNAFKYYHE